MKKVGTAVALEKSELLDDRENDLRPEADADLATRAGRGDPRAFDEVVRRFHQNVYRVCFRFFRSEEDAMDATQEVFLKAYRAIGRFEGRSSLKTWLYRIATNTCLSLAEEKKRAKKTMLGAVLDWFTAPPADDPGESVVEKEYRRELGLVIQERIARIPEVYRIPVILRDLEALSMEEISQILEIPEGTVKSRINRGRRLLQEGLEPFLNERRVP